MFRLAHISDIHLSPLPRVRYRELASKRITGYINWLRNRKDAMGGTVLDALVADMLAHAPGHVAVTGDLVVTADIPLASAVIEKGANALDPRGNWFTPENIRERLSVRDMMEQLRNAGIETGGPAPFSARDGKAFAAQLDRFLVRLRTSAAGGPRVP